ncbi:MAG: TIGR04211 family SH3 domain-containing protein [Magnetococcales bacterium]|nr:TIGR04211 family SH3 domain-containing protein [Magnetococcales bacterium]
MIDIFSTTATDFFSWHRPVVRLLSPLLLLLACATATPLQAENGYAVDDCRILMRRGPETRYKIVQMLKIGEEMEILEDDRESGWARVRATASGLEGWVLRRLISPEMPPQVQLDTIRETLRRAEEERTRLRVENEELRKRVGSQEKLEAELARIRKISQNALEIERENESLSQKVRHQEQEMKQLADDNRILERQTDTSFFLAGSAVLVVGMITGAVLARRRRTTFGSLE